MCYVATLNPFYLFYVVHTPFVSMAKLKQNSILKFLPVESVEILCFCHIQSKYSTSLDKTVPTVKENRIKYSF